MMDIQNTPDQTYPAEEDPTVDIGAIPKLLEAYSRIEIGMLNRSAEYAGLVLINQRT